MVSMTGYGYSEVQDDDASFSIELKSYNNRYLDIFINLPPFLSPLEPVIRDTIGKYVSRGRIELYLKYHTLQDSLELLLDEGAVDEYLALLNRLRDRAKIVEPITLLNLQQVEGLIKSHKKIDLEKVERQILPILKKTLESFVKSRKKEGVATSKDILKNIKKIESSLLLIENRADEIEEKIKSSIIARFNEMLGDNIDIQRVYSETAVLLVKYSINEEIERLKSHLDSFKEIATLDNPIGKKLDFLSQEMNREINTIGSKNMIKEISQAVVESKDSLEQIREQLRNIE